MRTFPAKIPSKVFRPVLRPHHNQPHAAQNEDFITVQLTNVSVIQTAPSPGRAKTSSQRPKANTVSSYQQRDRLFRPPRSTQPSVRQNSISRTDSAHQSRLTRNT